MRVCENSVSVFTTLHEPPLAEVRALHNTGGDWGVGVGGGGGWVGGWVGWSGHTTRVAIVWGWGWGWVGGWVGVVCLGGCVFVYVGVGGSVGGIIPMNESVLLWCMYE